MTAGPVMAEMEKRTGLSGELSRTASPLPAHPQHSYLSASGPTRKWGCRDLASNIKKNEEFTYTYISKCYYITYYYHSAMDN